MSVKTCNFILLGIFLSAAFGCEQPPPVHKPIADSTPHYPAHWWAPVSKDGAPAWEIMPQEASPSEVILSKRNELGVLSNFAATPFEFHGKRYASLEGFWQMMKYPEGPDDQRAKFPGIQWKLERDVVGQMTGFDAKRAGDVGSRNMEKMGIDWVTFEGKQMPYKPKEPGEHYRLIEEATRAKIEQNPEVKRILLATGNLVLKPDHHQEKDAPAAWRYYDILMKIRGELQKESSQSPPATSSGSRPLHE
ncbi:MAG TPA: NADAR family protein [Lacipirellulaceae bacterium]|jgi:predicted NAD-dependent protein-ADP-ribosyltransferase YbiA (DUF1768 family)|nr:NADAR family protein [Lacipirellulaceae bacterium]